MIPLASCQGRTFGVFGLARSGLSTIRAICAGGGNVFAWDDDSGRCAIAREAGATVQEPSAWPWEMISALVLSPGVPLTHPIPHPVVAMARERNVEIIGDVELFFREIAASKARVVAVTGTNGKSTTTALIAHILKGAGRPAEAAGNIGKPVLDLDPPSGDTIYVLELSSYQIDLSPGLASDIAVLLNISPDHLDRHGNMENYVAVKRRIFANLKKPSGAIVGVDDPYSAGICTALAANGNGRGVPISVGKALGRGISVIDGILYDGRVTPAAEVVDLRQARALPGAHNWQNAAAAYAVASMLGCESKTIVRGLLSFPGLPHRLEDVGQAGHVRFINDSKATNAEAAGRALSCFARIYWIAGGIPKREGIQSLAPYYPRIMRAYLIGEAAPEFARALEGRVPNVIAGDLASALSLAARDAASDGTECVVLLSPACASFDQFRDFEDRGERFRLLVADALKANKPGEAAA